MIWEFEDEQGKSGTEGLLRFAIEYDFSPGEPMVRYYPDGSGYPGSDTEVEFTNFRCVSIDGEFVDGATAKRLGEWFEEYIQGDSSEYDRMYEEVCRLES